MDNIPLEKYLKDAFGYDAFREQQKEAIESIVYKRRDVVCIMPTGGGKSICYQLPPIVMKQPAVIISPLLSLMEDQRVGLEKNGIKACCYNSTIANKARANEDILKGVYSHIYITPETVLNCENLLKMLNINLGISVIAIDESHCVSLWGNTFRSSYLKLACLKQWLPDVPVLALTATATPPVETDIITLLKLNNPLRIRISSNRPNLSYYVHIKKDPLTDLKAQVGTESSIIYCQTRDSTENIANVLTENGVKCSAYHAGLSDGVRTKIHHEFLEDKITCIVATISFGMGIDKPDIRKVIHYGCPKDIESYFQETGRAGRDGKPSTCLIYYAPTDFATNRYFLKDIFDDKLRQYKEHMIYAMEKYLYITDCRRKYLLNYFGEVAPTQPVCCDNCSNTVKRKEANIGSAAKMFLELVAAFSGKFGKAMFIKTIKGENLKKIPASFKAHSHYGAGKMYTENAWKMCVQHLINSDLLTEKAVRGGYGATLHISPKGLEWLKVNEENPVFMIEVNS